MKKRKIFYLLLTIIFVFISLIAFQENDKEALTRLLDKEESKFNEIVSRFRQLKEDYPDIYSFEVTDERKIRLDFIGKPTERKDLNSSSFLWELCNDIFSLYPFNGIQVNYDNNNQEVITLYKITQYDNEYLYSYMSYIDVNYNFYYSKGNINDYKTYPNEAVRFFCRTGEEYMIKNNWYYMNRYADTRG